MNYNAKTVQPLPNYQICVELESGFIGTFDLKPHLEKGVWRELKNIDYFNQVFILYGAVTWQNEQDIEPQTLFEGLKPLQIINIKPLENYQLLVNFNNQVTKKYDMSKLLEEESFKPLKNIELFNQAQAKLHGIIWNSEIDIAEYELWKNGQTVLK